MRGAAPILQYYFILRLFTESFSAHAIVSKSNSSMPRHLKKLINASGVVGVILISILYAKPALSFSIKKFLGLNESSSPNVVGPRDTDRQGISPKNQCAQHDPNASYGPLGPLLVVCNPQVRSNSIEVNPIENHLFDKVLEKLSLKASQPSNEYLVSKYSFGFSATDIRDCKKYTTELPSLNDLSPTLSLKAIHICSPRNAILLLEVEEGGEKAAYIIDPYNFNKIYTSIIAFGQKNPEDEGYSRSAMYFGDGYIQGLGEYRWANAILARIINPNKANDSDQLKTFGIKVKWCDRTCLDRGLKKAAELKKGPSFISPGAWIANTDGAFVVEGVYQGSRADKACLKGGDIIQTIGARGSIYSPKNIQDLGIFIESVTVNLELDIVRLEKGDWTRKGIVVRPFEWYGTASCADDYFR